MLIANTTREALEYALEQANRHYSGNLRWREIELKRHTRKGEEVWKVNLTVRPRAERLQCDECGEIREHCNHWSKAYCRTHCEPHRDGFKHHRYRRGMNTEGVALRYGYGNRREHYIAAACWHAHGVFFDGLNADARIKSGSMHAGKSFGTGGKWLRADEYNWRNGDGDVNVGSMIYPAMASELCDCQGFAPKVDRYRPMVVRATEKMTKALPEITELFDFSS